jgi:folate-binding protein YgfZ
VICLNGSAVFELWLPADTAEATIGQLLGIAAAVPLNNWQLQQIRNGVGQVFFETRESFIPQMLNLQIFNAVSFKKGCYTGQEIVARMKYLGKLKKRMFRLTSDKQQRLPPGTPVVNSDTGQVLGEIVLSALGPQHMEMLAVVQKDAAQSASLSAIDGQGPALTRAPLPYESEVTDTEAAR